MEKLPLRVKIIYGFGEWGVGAATTARTLFWLLFLSTVAGVDIGVASAAAAIGRIWDAINDPLIGIVSDQLQTRWGRRRPFLVIGAIPFGVTFYLLFSVPPFQTERSVAFYYIAVFILFDTLFTIIDVPLAALAPTLTEDYDERSSLSGWRTTGFLSASLLTATLFKLLAEQLFAGWFGGDLAKGYGLAAGIWGILMMIPPLLVYFSIEEPKYEPPRSQTSFWAAQRQVFNNRPFLLAAIVYLATFTAGDVVAAVLVWYLDFYIQAAPGFESLALGSMMIISLAMMPVIVKLMRRFGKRRSYIGFMFYWMLILGLISQIPPGGQNLILLAAALSGIGYGAANAIPWAIVADVVETDELETGQRREGTYSGFMVFLRKLAGGAAIFIAGQILDKAGFIEGIAGSSAANQPPQALFALRFLVSGVPILLLLIAIAAIWRFPMERTDHDQIRRQLAARRTALTATSKEG